MRILHTADWHLGQRFHYQSRHEENVLVLDWLLETIQQADIDLLVVAGDVFDIGNPPNQARQLYYSFLGKLALSACKHVVITGGNHDSPSMLDAPGDLLRQLNIHIVGSAPAHPEEQIIELKNSDGSLQGVVAAVPFLRDRDIRTAVPGEAYATRVESIQEGIRAHYEALAVLVQPYKQLGVPIIATGHLYAKGATAGDHQDNIYLGDRENLKAEDFPDCFDYIALGHLHRAQMVGNCRQVRYSGSLLPLSFSEINDPKSVTLVDFSNTPQHPEIRLLPTPVFRRLRTVTGTFEEVKVALLDLNASWSGYLHDWVDVFLAAGENRSGIQSALQELAADLNLELLKIRLNIQQRSLEQETEDHRQLDDFTPLEVFRKKCESIGLTPPDVSELETTFAELLTWMEDQQEEARAQ